MEVLAKQLTDARETEDTGGNHSERPEGEDGEEEERGGEPENWYDEGSYTRISIHVD